MDRDRVRLSGNKRRSPLKRLQTVRGVKKTKVGALTRSVARHPSTRARQKTSTRQVQSTARQPANRSKANRRAHQPAACCCDRGQAGCWCVRAAEDGRRAVGEYADRARSQCREIRYPTASNAAPRSHSRETSDAAANALLTVLMSRCRGQWKVRQRDLVVSLRGIPLAAANERYCPEHPTGPGVDGSGGTEHADRSEGSAGRRLPSALPTCTVDGSYLRSRAGLLTFILLPARADSGGRYCRVRLASQVGCPACT